MRWNSFKFNRADLFVLSWIIYYLQGVAYPMGSPISITLLGINLAYSLYCGYKVSSINGNPAFFRGLNYLLLLFTIYGLFMMLIGEQHSTSDVPIPNITYLKGIYLSLLPIFSFYYLAVKGYLTSQKMRFYIIFFFVSAYLSFQKETMESLEIAISRGSSREEFTNNAGYLFLSLIPLLVLIRKRKLLQFGSLAVIMVFLVLSMKRGAMISGVLCSLFFICTTFKNSNQRQKVAIVIFTFAMLLALSYYIENMLQNSDYMVARINATLEGDSSGRNEIYKRFLEYFINQNSLIHFLIGNGAYATLGIFHKLAHNDWLEIAINQGLLGILVYLNYWIYFIQTIRRSQNTDSKIAISLLGLIFLFRSLVSMSYDDMTFLATSTLGFYLAQTNKKNIS